MNLDDRLDRVRAELADEVASDVRMPSFDGVLARRARRRRLQATAAGAVLVVVAAGVVGGVAATRPGPHHSVPPAATVSASPQPSASNTPPPSASTSPTTAPTSAQTYPAKGASYVVVPDGDQLAWTDLKTGAHGHFGPQSGQVSSPSVSADGRRVAFVEAGGDFAADAQGLTVWDLDSRTQTKVTSGDVVTSPQISPDGTKILWAVHGVVRVASLGAPTSVQEVDLNSGEAAWVGNAAIAYLTDPAVKGGSDGCVVMRRDLSADHATRCLLPTATLQSVFTPHGSAWQAVNITSNSNGSLFALALTSSVRNGGLPDSAIGLLDPHAEATPLRVLPATVTQVGMDVGITAAVLSEQSTRLLYTEVSGINSQGPVRFSLVSLDLTTGMKTTTPVGDGVTTLGATSG